MKKINSILKTLFICLFAMVLVGANTTIISSATEADDVATEATEDTEEVLSSETVEGSVVAIIEVQDYTIDGGMLEAGKDVTINLTLHNTSDSASATSTLMTMTSESKMVYPVYGDDNQLYVGTIGAGKTKTVSVPVTVSSQFREDALDFTCHFDYVTSGNRMSNSSTIIIPTSGGTTLGVKSIEMSSHAIVNGKSLLSFRYANNSGTNITDAKLIIDGNVSNESKSIKLDTAYAGKSYNKDFYVTFVKDGNQEIAVSLEYTDIDGKEVKTELGTYRILVSKEATETESSTPNMILVWIGRLVSLLVLAGAACLTFIYIKKH